MALRVIELDPSDTFYSMRDRLLRGGRGRMVLVLPGRKPRPSGIDLALLRRLADRERLEIGLVTNDRALARQARAIGLPTFANLTLAEHYRPGWRHGGRRSERIGFSPGEERRPADLVAGEGSTSVTAGRQARLWLLSALFTWLFLLSLAVLSIIILIPRAVVSLRLATLPAQVILNLTTGSNINTPNDNIVPSRIIQHAIEWEASGTIANDATADQQRIHAQALQGISAAAPDMLEARLDAGEMLIPSSIRVEVTEESFTQADQSDLILRTNITGTAVAVADLRRVANNALVDVLPDGYEPEPGSLRLYIEPARDASPGAFQLTATATGRPIVDRETLASQLVSRRTAEANTLLTSAIPLAEPPVIIVEPGWWQTWFGRLPLRTGQIEVEIRP